MLGDKLKKYNVILASASPRRQAFLEAMEIDFEIQLKSIEEIYPCHLKGSEITDYLAKLKAEAFKDNIKPEDILITSDTIVWVDQTALGKPKDQEEAYKMLRKLSNKSHNVMTSICVTHNKKQTLVNTSTEVHFRTLTDQEIWHYISTYNPLDKAGAYGIQDWIGAIGITQIKGSYNNVVGLPTHLLYQTLTAITDNLS